MPGIVVTLVLYLLGGAMIVTLFILVVILLVKKIEFYNVKNIEKDRNSKPE